MKVILLGAPGAGKGTYASKLKKIYNLSHISTGELLRQAIASENETGLQAKELIDKGEYLPDEMMIELLKQELEKTETGIILDGFPRTITQAEMLKEIAKIDAVLKFDVEEKTVLRRLANRLTCKNCGEIFHKINIKPKKESICDKCQGELYQREDDKEETILNRLKIYHEKTAPLEDYYKNLGILKNINSNLDMNDPKITVIKECQKILDEIQNNL